MSEATFITGVLSITFRQLSPEQIIALTVQAGLDAIAWGGDVHVPHGDLARATDVARLTRAAGLRVGEYASYYRAGQSEENGLPFATVLATALALGAKSIRVWAGVKGSTSTTAEERAGVVADLRRITALATTAGVTVAMELHDNTLTDTVPSTVTLLGEVGAAELRTHWQPPHGVATETAVAGLATLRPWLHSLHVFHWWPTLATRLPLAEGAERWRAFLAEAKRHGGEVPLLMEFVAGDAPEVFLRDAAALRSWLG
jgi:3-dehydroshikimate dehydratase